MLVGEEGVARVRMRRRSSGGRELIEVGVGGEGEEEGVASGSIGRGQDILGCC